MKIDFANLQYQLYKTEIDEATQLESSLQDFTGAKYAITCASGTDALLLAMLALDIQPGDEIITTPFTFIATAND